MAPAAGRWEEAARLCQNLMYLPQAPVELWYWLAVVRRFQGLLEQAEAAVVAFLRRERGCSCAWWIYGKIEQDRKRPERAVSHFCRAVALEPRCAGLWYALSRAYEETGHVEAELAALKRACELGGEPSPKTQARLAWLLDAVAQRTRSGHSTT